MSSKFRALILLTMLFAFVVIVLGAYTRLSDAGLGCPDWPGCYGKLLGVPDTETDCSVAVGVTMIDRIENLREVAGEGVVGPL